MSERSLFIRALEIDDPVQRDELLTRECGNDAELRRRIERLLSAHTAAGGILDKPPVNPPATDLFRPITEGPGTVIGPYKLLQQIGEGGFGVVYMAEQQRPVRRKVALKIIKPGMDTREVIARFESERQALALMDHPNIARVLDAGATDSGRPYFVMELVKGVPITDYCDKNTLPTEKRLELFITVCHAVQHAHQKGVIHRDIKPSNVMVTLHDGQPVPKVIDFGVSKATSQQLTERTLFTAYGQMIGTPAYMSPEQAEMSGLDIDTRSDLYSLGVLLYELLTGSTPFDGKRLREAGYLEMQRIIREEAPPRPSTRVSTLGEALTVLSNQRSTDPKKLGQQLRGDLDVIVMKALEKERNRRYDTPNAFADDIQRFLNHEAIVARPASAAYRLRKFAERNKAAVAAGTAIAAALLLGTTISTGLAIRAERSNRLAQSERSKAEASLAEAVAAKSQVERERDRAEKAKAQESIQRQRAEEQRLAAEQQRLAAEEQRLAAEAAEKAAAAERTAAVQERDKATAASAELARQKEQQRRLLYVAQMGLIQKAWEADNIPRIRDLLNATRPHPGETDLRGLEWHYWQRMIHQEEHSFRLPVRLPAPSRGFTAGTAAPAAQFAATSAKFSPDGTRLAVIDPDETSSEGAEVLKVWDTTTDASEPILSRALPRLPASSEQPAPGFDRFVTRNSARRSTIGFLDAQRIVLAHSNSTGGRIEPNDLERLRNASTEERRQLFEELSRQRQASAETVLQSFDLTAPPNAAWQPRASFNVPTDYVFSTDGSRLATRTPNSTATDSPSDTILILDGQTGATLDQFPSPFPRFALRAISNSGQRLVIAESPPPTPFGGPRQPPAQQPQPQPQVLILHRDSGHSVPLQLPATFGSARGSITLPSWEFSPDAAQLAVSSRSSPVSAEALLRFDAISGRELPTSRGAQPTASSSAIIRNTILAFSLDGKWLVAGAGDPDLLKLALWDTATGQPGPEIKGHAAPPVLAAFSADSTRLLTADSDGFVKVWKLPAPDSLARSSLQDPRAQLLSRLNPSSWNIPSPDGRWTATAPRPSTSGGFGSSQVTVEPPYELQLTDKSDRIPPRVIPLPGPAHTLEFSPDGSLLASVTIDPVANLEEAVELRIWNVATGQPLPITIPRFRATQLPGPRGRGSFPPPGKSENPPVSQQPSRRTTSTAPPVFSPDGRWLVAGFLPKPTAESFGKTHLYLLDLQRSREISVTIPQLPNYSVVGRSGTLLRFSPDSKLLLSTTSQITSGQGGFSQRLDRSQAFHVVATNTGEFLWQASSILMNSASFSADSQRVAAISLPSAAPGMSRESAILFWEASTGQEQARIELPPNRGFTALAISPNGDRAAVQSPAGVTVYEVATKKELYSLEGVAGRITFTPDGQRLVTTAVPNASRSDFGTTFPGFPPAGGFLFESLRTSGTDAKVWDAVTGQELLSFSADSPLYTEFQASGAKDGFAPLNPQIEAESIVAWLSAANADGQLLTRGQIAERIQSDPSLSQETRSRALQLAAQRRRSVSSLATPALEVLHTTGLPREKYQQALEWLAEAIDQSPQEAAYISRRGMAHYRLGDYPAALASLEQSVQLRSADNLPPLADTLAFLAMTHHQFGHAEQARQFFYQAEREYQAVLRRNNSSSRFSGFTRGNDPAGDADSFSATTPSAFGSLTEASALLGLKKVSDHIAAGNALRTKKEYDQALAEFDTAIALDPQNATAYYERARAWREKPDLDKMLADCEQAILLDPKTAEHFNLRGIAWELKREYPKAVEDYTHALEMQPNNATYLSNRGYTYYRKREFDRALADFDEAIRLGKKDLLTYAGRARTHHQLGNLDQALADSQTAIDLTPGAAGANAYRDRGNLWMAEKQFDLAIRDHSEFIKLLPDSPIGYSNRGSCLVRLGKLDEAFHDADKAVHLEPNNSLYLSNRAAVLTLLGRYTEALADLKKGQQLDPKLASLRFLGGYLFQKQHQPDLAKPELDEFLKMFPQQSDALRDRANRWLILNEWAQAIADYEQLLALEPENIRERTTFAWLLATCPDEKLRDGKKALDLATRASELTDGKQNNRNKYTVLDTLAAAHAQLGNFPEAISFAEKALPLAPKHIRPAIESRLALYRDHKPYRESPVFQPAHASP